ncbi:MAG: metal ABC transporter substrate-binding protein [Lachnospiraceae bacterium]|nr:metal ABC transporter substrate-binding protein [Lachnospiraceae bacterium]
MKIRNRIRKKTGNKIKSNGKGSRKGRFIQTACCVIAAGILLCGCTLRGDGGGAENPSGEPKEYMTVSTTLFPYYDFVRQIAGDRVKLNLVVPAGMDSHSFEPTPADMIEIQNSDIFLYNGGEMEQWVEEALESIGNPDIHAVSMMEYVDVVEEELVEGMEHEEHEQEGHTHEEHEPGQLHEIEYDEHIWTSPVNAMKIVEVISQILSEEDPAHQAVYEENTRRYLEELKAVDAGFRQVMENRKRDMVVVGDRFPFRYLADTYGFQYRAAFSGCAGDTEPSARTIAYLIDQVREQQLPAVYYLELSSHRVAEIISEETGARPLLLHSCHNVSRREFDEGVTYLQLMEQNVVNLRIGLDAE